MSKKCIRHGCSKSARRKFCSATCRIAHHNGRRLPATKSKIVCQSCGTVFRGRPDQKTCGATCRSRLFRLRHLSVDLEAKEGGERAVDRLRPAPFSPAELRERVQGRQCASEVEYSWLPKSPKPVRVGKIRENLCQLHLDFGSITISDGDEIEKR